MELSNLPDDILVRIGTHVGKLCGIKDFLALSSTSKRFKRLLTDSESTVSEVIRIRISQINDDAAVQNLLSAAGSSPPDVRTLKQLSFFESVANHKILQENRIYGRNGDILDYAPMDTTSRPFHERSSHLEGIEVKLANKDTIALILGVQDVLKHFPSATVVLEAHSGAQTPGGIADLYSNYRGDVVREVMTMGAEELLDRFTTNGWGSKVTQQAAKSEHPYAALAKQGMGWVEVYLRFPDIDGSNNEGLELPPRPEFYAHVKK